MKNVFVTAYDSFSDYKLLKNFYDILLSKLEKKELFFYCTVGSSGDNTCMKYIKENNLQVSDWLNPRKGKTIKKEREKILNTCDYAIIITKGYHKGMKTAIDQCRKFLNGTFIVISTNLSEIIKCDKKLQTIEFFGYDDKKIYKKKIRSRYNSLLI